METTCRLLKLRSGEEVLCLLAGENESMIHVLRPMVIKSHMTYDSFGITREITVLRNWLEFTEAEEVDIPKDHIATILKPTNSTIDLYQNSIRKEEKAKKTLDDAHKKLDEILENEDTFNQMLKDLMGSDSLDDKEKSKDNPKHPTMPFPFGTNQHSVGMYFSIPPNLFEDLLENGLLDFDVFMGPMDEDGDEIDEALIPEMEIMTDKEKDKLKKKGINLEDFPDDPRKYIDDISEDTKE
jgi:hypothetical protein